MNISLQKETETILKEKVRIASKSYNELKKLDKAITRHYHARTISVNGFKQLDGMILNRMIRLDTQG